MKKQLEFNFNQTTDDLANKIVDNSYNNSKKKNPFTLAAEKAKDLLSHTYNPTTGKFDNSEGNELPAKEAVKVNEFWDKNFQEQKQDDYLKKLKTFGIEESAVSHPGYPKVSNQKIFKDNINNKLTPEQRRKQNYLKTWGIEDGPHNHDFKNIIKKAVNEADEEKNNPTVNKYKTFKEDQKKKLEEKKFNENMEKEYGPKAIAKYIRDKENKNIKAGKPPYYNFSTSNIIVAEDIKEKAKIRLKSMKLPESTSGFKGFVDYEAALNRDQVEDPRSKYLKERFEQILKENEEAKLKEANAGIAGLMGGTNGK